MTTLTPHAYRSRDGGLHWEDEGFRFGSWRIVGANEELHTTLRGDGPFDPRRDRIAVPSGTYGAIGNKYYFCFSKRIYVSANKGLSWYAHGTFPEKAILCSAFHALSGQLFVGTERGLFRAGPAADNWQLVEPLGTRQVRRLFGGPGGEFYVNVLGDKYNGHSHVSQDGGKSWAPISFPQAISPSPGYQLVGIVGTVLFATEQGNLISSDNGGVTWSAPHEGVGSPSDESGRYLHEIRGVVDGGDGVQYAYTQRSVFKRTTPDGQWERLLLKSLDLP
ncbi:hypothetical protein PO883_00365 [Massilia sp. DJPM01]|uniref:hypothetical protein n=1 Tax=Massilia sp. DJPM01 TaxID=3024404 RepID=UPI00259FDC32|nr:hypothetical protein [Massilia sp. DJPM01]MDM5175664.1 hypothetical protein [Massilia sp. DJPM01]